MVYDKESLKIFIVEDDEVVLKLIEDILNRIGYQHIITSKSCEEAIQLIKEHLPDLFFIDIMMPGMSGDQFRGLLKENPKTKDIPVIFISGIISKKEEEDMEGHLKSGDIIIAKPLTVERINSAIAECFSNISAD